MTGSIDYRRPECNTPSEWVLGPEQAFFTNVHSCRIIIVNPSLQDGGFYVHLHEVEYLAEQDNEWSTDDTDTARTLISDLVLAIRGLLIEHKPQSSSDCQICTPAWPCPVVTTIHAFVKDPQRQFAALVLRARDDG